MEGEPERDDFARSASILANAQGVNISGGDFRAVQGRYVNIFHGDIHHHPEGIIKPSTEKAIWKALEAVPNFRKIYQDMLSKATEGTGIWLLKNEKFRIWLEANGDIKIFWGSGMPGAGKTVLASLVIQHLEALHERSPDGVCVCYYYFRYSDSVDLTLKGVLESLLKQTLERHPECLALAEKVYSQNLREGTQPSEVQLLGLLRQFTDGMETTFYVLDAFDEAPQKVRVAVVRTLSSLKVKVFMTSRPLESMEAVLPLGRVYKIEISAQEEDIERHVEEGIEESFGLINILKQEGESLRQEILSTIKRRSGGMFLHASLQMDALRTCVSLDQVRLALDDFPPDIEGIYNQTWDRIHEESPHLSRLARAVFLWVLNAERSMTLQELERAVATSPDTFQFEAHRIVPGETLIAVCRGLLVLEAESHIVRLVHYTAKQHLRQMLHPSYPHPHSLLVNICITHLKERGMQNSTIASEEDFITVLRHDPLLSYASDAWAFHARQSLDIESARESTSAFVRDITFFPALLPSFIMEFARFDLLRPLHIIALYHLPLDLLADLGDIDSSTGVHQQSPLMVACRSCNEDMVKALLGSPNIKINQTDGTGWTGLMRAAQNGHEAVATLLLACHKIQVNQATHDGGTALMIAAENGHESVATLLLAHPEIQVNQAALSGWMALMSAAQNGRESVAILLLSRPEIQVNQVKSDGGTALMVAAFHGHEDVATLLLARAETQVNQANNKGWTALMFAALSGCESVAILLLSRPEVQVNQVNSGGGTALMVAVRNGHDSVVTLLLDRPEIQVNQATHDGGTALMIAAQNGHDSVVTLLLDRPETQVNQAGNEGWTALMSAAQNGHESVATLLLARAETQVNQADNEGWTALMFAAQNGHESVATLLLDRPETQVNQADNKGWTALMSAAQNGHESVATLLLDRPETQVNQAGNEGWTALMFAARNGHESVATLVLSHPAIQVNQVTTTGATALILAAQNGHEPVVRILLLAPGIDRSIKNKDGDTAATISLARGHLGIHRFLQEHLFPCLEHPQDFIPLNFLSRSVSLLQNQSHSASPPPAPTGTPVNERPTATQSNSQPDTHGAPNNDGDVFGSVVELALSFLLHIV